MPWKHGSRAGENWRTIGLVDGDASDVRRRGLKTNHRFYGLFQSVPDLFWLLLHRRVPRAPVLCTDAP